MGESPSSVARDMILASEEYRTLLDRAEEMQRKLDEHRVEWFQMEARNQELVALYDDAAAVIRRHEAETTGYSVHALPKSTLLLLIRVPLAVSLAVLGRIHGDVSQMYDVEPGIHLFDPLDTPRDDLVRFFIEELKSNEPQSESTIVATADASPDEAK